MPGSVACTEEPELNLIWKYGLIRGGEFVGPAAEEFAILAVGLRPPTARRKCLPASEPEG